MYITGFFNWKMSFFLTDVSLKSWLTLISIDSNVWSSEVPFSERIENGFRRTIWTRAVSKFWKRSLFIRVARRVIHDERNTNWKLIRRGMRRSCTYTYYKKESPRTKSISDGNVRGVKEEENGGTSGRRGEAGTCAGRYQAGIRRRARWPVRGKGRLSRPKAQKARFSSHLWSGGYSAMKIRTSERGNVQSYCVIQRILQTVRWDRDS